MVNQRRRHKMGEQKWTYQQMEHPNYVNFCMGARFDGGLMEDTLEVKHLSLEETKSSSETTASNSLETLDMENRRQRPVLPRQVNTPNGPAFVYPPTAHQSNYQSLADLYATESLRYRMTDNSYTDLNVLIGNLATYQTLNDRGLSSSNVPTRPPPGLGYGIGAPTGPAASQSLTGHPTTPSWSNTSTFFATGVTNLSSRQVVDQSQTAHMASAQSEHDPFAFRTSGNITSTSSMATQLPPGFGLQVPSGNSQITYPPGYDVNPHAWGNHVHAPHRPILRQDPALPTNTAALQTGMLNVLEQNIISGQSAVFQPSVSSASRSHISESKFGVVVDPKVTSKQALTFHTAPPTGPRNMQGHGISSFGTRNLESNITSQQRRNLQRTETASGHHIRHRATRRRAAEFAVDNGLDPMATTRKPWGLPYAGTANAGASHAMVPYVPSTQASLPSVLNPFSRVPLMTYKEALEAIKFQAGPLNMILEDLDPKPVSVVLYDTVGRPLTVSEGLILTKDVTIIYLITFIQLLIERYEEEHQTKEKLIVKAVEIRVGTLEITKGYPALKGEPMEGDEDGFWAKWVRWECNTSDMEKYWAGYRNLLQLGGSQQVEKPIFKVRTVRQIPLDPGHMFAFGHFFDVTGVVPGPDCQEVDDTGNEAGSSLLRLDGGADHTVDLPGSSTASGAHGTSQPDAVQLTRGEIRRTGGLDPSNITSSNAGHGAPKNGQPKSRAIHPTRNWGYYQRMGGDPRMHELYPLDHVPFEEEDFPPPRRPAYTTPDIFVTIIDEDAVQDGHGELNEQGGDGTLTDAEHKKAVSGLVDEVRSDGSLTPKAAKFRITDPAEVGWRAQAAREHEAAIGFDSSDDDTFFPAHNRNILGPTKPTLSDPGKRRQQSKRNQENEMLNDHSNFDQFLVPNSPGMTYTAMNVHAPCHPNFQVDRQSGRIASPYHQGFNGPRTDLNAYSSYSYLNAPARTSTPAMRYPSPVTISPKTLPSTTTTQRFPPPGMVNMQQNYSSSFRPSQGANSQFDFSFDINLYSGHDSARIGGQGGLHSGDQGSTHYGGNI